MVASPHVPSATITDTQFNHSNQVILTSGTDGILALTHISGQVVALLTSADSSDTSLSPETLPSLRSFPGDSISSIAFSTGSRFVACTVPSPPNLALWDMKRKRKVLSLNLEWAPTHVTMALKDQRIVWGDESGAAHWTAVTSGTVHTLLSPISPVIQSPLTAAETSRPAPIVRVWAAGSGLLALAADGALHLWTRDDSIGAASEQAFGHLSDAARGGSSEHSSHHHPWTKHGIILSGTQGAASNARAPSRAVGAVSACGRLLVVVSDGMLHLYVTEWLFDAVRSRPSDSIPKNYDIIPGISSCVIPSTPLCTMPLVGTHSPIDMCICASAPVGIIAYPEGRLIFLNLAAMIATQPHRGVTVAAVRRISERLIRAVGASSMGVYLGIANSNTTIACVAAENAPLDVPGAQKDITERELTLMDELMAAIEASELTTAPAAAVTGIASGAVPDVGAHAQKPGLMPVPAAEQPISHRAAVDGEDAHPKPVAAPESASTRDFPIPEAAMFPLRGTSTPIDGSDSVDRDLHSEIVSSDASFPRSVSVASAHSRPSLVPSLASSAPDERVDVHRGPIQALKRDNFDHSSDDTMLPKSMVERLLREQRQQIIAEMTTIMQETFKDSIASLLSSHTQSIKAHSRELVSQLHMEVIRSSYDAQVRVENMREEQDRRWQQVTEQLDALTKSNSQWNFK